MRNLVRQLMFFSKGHKDLVFLWGKYKKFQLPKN